MRSGLRLVDQWETRKTAFKISRTGESDPTSAAHSILDIFTIRSKSARRFAARLGLFVLSRLAKDIEHVSFHARLVER